MSTTFQQRDTHGHTHTHTQGMCCHTTGAILASHYTCLPGWYFILSRENWNNWGSVELFFFSYWGRSERWEWQSLLPCPCVCLCVWCVGQLLQWKLGIGDSEVTTQNEQGVGFQEWHTHTHTRKKMPPSVRVFQMLHGQKIVPVWAADAWSLRCLFA